MIQVEAFQEFRTGLAFLRGGDANKALPHLKVRPRRRTRQSFLYFLHGSGHRGNGAEVGRGGGTLPFGDPHEPPPGAALFEPCRGLRAADRKAGRADTLVRGLRYAPHDQRLKIGLDRLAIRRPPVLPFLPRAHSMNRNLGKLRHHAMQVLATF